MQSDKISVGYFGTPGSFTHAAALAYFSSKSTFINVTTFEDIFHQVKDGKIDKGIIPIENTLAGSIYENYDLLDQYRLTVTGESYLRIEHFLLVAKGLKTNLKSIKKVYSHQKALEQCSRFFDEHPWMERIEFTDTAHAAKMVAELKDSSVAAIAGMRNVDIYDVDILLPNIENNNQNFTRFIVIGKSQDTPLEEANKCSLTVNLSHVAGSLGKAFSVLTDMGCNLTKIESRPIHDMPFEYTFYLDFQFDAAQHDIDEILEKLEKAVLKVTLLGLYRAGHM